MWATYRPHEQNSIINNGFIISRNFFLIFYRFNMEQPLQRHNGFSAKSPKKDQSHQCPKLLVPKHTFQNLPYLKKLYHLILYIKIVSRNIITTTFIFVLFSQTWCPRNSRSTIALIHNTHLQEYKHVSDYTTPVYSICDATPNKDTQICFCRKHR